MRWLVTGGAGYIGAHVARRILEAGEGLGVVVVDSLLTGDARRLLPICPMHLCSVLDSRSLFHVFNAHRFDGVIHLAARKSVPESVTHPDLYRGENVGGLVKLLDVMGQFRVRRLVFASSAAVYGPQLPGLIGEDAELAPANPYGESKLSGEKIIAHSTAQANISTVVLRLFNVAGTAYPGLGDLGGSLFPALAAAAAGRGRAPIYGDGSAVRDWVHVADVADAVLSAMALLEDLPPEVFTLNIGSGRGHSVTEAVYAMRRAAGRDVPTVTLPARVGEPAHVVANVGAARRLLDYAPLRGLHEIASSLVEAGDFACR